MIIPSFLLLVGFSGPVGDKLNAKLIKTSGANRAGYLESRPMKTENPSVQLIPISEDEAGQRIDNFLRNILKGVPKSMIYRIVRKGEVRVNKKRIKPEYKLLAGDEVRVPPVRVAERDEAPVSAKLDKVAALADCILYEDDHLLILNKPSGTAVHGGSGLSFGVIEGLRALRPDARFLELVHRLDRDTSGVLLVAKKRSALRSLHEQLRMKGMQKDYLALVQGEWQSHCKVVQAPLLKNILQSGERIVRVSAEGKPSETRFKIEERYEFATLIKASPVTGRTHQIRVHAQYAGHPIAFDDRYGDRDFDGQLAGTGLNRLFLHAAALRFEHPGTGETMRIEAPMDAKLRNCLKKLRLKPAKG
jgi:23S rRNA pseudouridine955/2504/2580 synthase